MTSQLEKSLLEYIADNFNNAQTHNYDLLRFENPKALSFRALRNLFVEVFKQLLSWFGLSRTQKEWVRNVFSSYSEIHASISQLEETYDLLADDASRAWMVSLLAYRVLGGQRVKLYSNTPEYWAAVHDVRTKLKSSSQTIDIGGFMGILKNYDLGPIGFNIKILSHPLYILTTFLLQQYSYQQAEQHAIEARSGDVVIDGGGCWGDTALYFAQKVGNKGKVYCFEFSPENKQILHQNLQKNPLLARGIEVISHALWDKSDRSLNYTESGPGTKVLENNNEIDHSNVLTMSIDDFVERYDVTRVDFIKLDIEGAELATLEGATKVLKAYRPKLAVAIYHHLEDWITIPQFLHSLNLGYRFYIGHFTIHLEETVLFAVTDDHN